MQKNFSFLVVFWVLLYACAPKVYVPSKMQYRNYEIVKLDSQSVAAKNIKSLLGKYSDSINKTMNTIIGQNAEEMQKKQPECNLGNFLADAMLAQSRKIFKNVDASFINYGGIRLNSVPKGPITNGKIYELSPFDNNMVVLTITGKVLKEFIDHTANRGGWPMAGVQYKLINKTAHDVKINGVMLDEFGSYKIAVVDYVANGGDDCKMLTKLPRQDKGIVFRDALIEYVKDLNAKGKLIESKVENRVIVL